MPPKTNAAAAAGKPKLNAKRSRKIRTAFVESSSSSSSSEASSDTDSDSSAARDSAPTPAKKQKTTASTTTTTAARDAVTSSSSSDSEDSEPEADGVASASVSAAAFPSWYLRTVTQELAEDLDKVRNAPDFGDAALPLLVHALQQGEGVFSGVEKARVMAAAGER